jgi:hypothetical protein
MKLKGTRKKRDDGRLLVISFRHLLLENMGVVKYPDNNRSSLWEKRVIEAW